jgi:hypothetical protein
VGVQHIRHYTVPGMTRVLRSLGYERISSMGQSFHLNGSAPFTLLSLLHGGNRGLRLLVRMATLGRVSPEFPGLHVRMWVIRKLAWLMPRLSPGMLFVAHRPQAGAAPPPP